MGATVYVETNFLMSVAMGREAIGEDLLAAVSASVRIAIPSGCYMESFSAFSVSINSFRTVANVLGWLGSLPP